MRNPSLVVLTLFVAGAVLASGGVPEDEVTLLIVFKTKEPTDCSGSISVRPGRVVGMRGWRFKARDSVQGDRWKLNTRRATPRGWKQREAVKAGKKLAVQDNGVFVHLAGVRPQSRITLSLKQGERTFQLSDVPYGARYRPRPGLTIERCPPSRQIAGGPEDEDYPAAAVGRDGTVWTAYVAFTRGKRFAGVREKPQPGIKDFSYLAEPTGGDQIWLRACRRDRWSEPIAVTPPGQDLYRPTIAIDGQGAVWVIYSQNVGAGPDLTGGNWELQARRYLRGKWSSAVNVSRGPGPDAFPAATTDAQGRVWVAWMAARADNFDIYAAVQQGDRFGAPVKVSTSAANDWAPAIAADRRGGVAVAWDTYDRGDYDVYVSRLEGGRFVAPVAVAAGTEHDCRPTIAYDKLDRLWIAWEQAGPLWGKDQGALDRDSGGLRLYAPRRLRVKVWDGAGWWIPSQAVAKVTPTRAKKQPRVAPGKAAHLVDTVTGLNPTFPRIAVGDDGAVWIAFRGRRGGMRHRVGTVFWEFATRFDGRRWLPPILLSDSDNILDNRPALLPLAGGRLLVAGASDERHKHPRGGVRPKNAPADQPIPDPVNNNLYATLLAAPSTDSVDIALQPAEPALRAEQLPVLTAEIAAVQRMRAYRADVRGQEVKLMRGEFHRHTEISSDGGGDSALIDMWRYALDAAYMDWIGNGDHDNGSGREYSWWTIQKTTDLFQIGTAFVPMFSYERSVSYPEGHRNVVFARRGVRTLPRLPKSDPNIENPPPAPDTEMLYRYLRQFDGVCAEHTSGTNMGTDWRNNASDVEPFVEIYQGARQNYERPGAPRSNSEKNSIGGWRAKGFVSLALVKGYRLAFQSSSDHGSTHISYCNVWVTQPTRAGILEGMKRRRVYASTDNIVADVRCTVGGEEHFMGEEFTVSKPPRFSIHLHGLEPFAKVTIVRQNEYVYTVSPGKAVVDLQWTDNQPAAGKTLYYYVRGEQSDGELVWVSPMWIRYDPQA